MSSSPLIKPERFAELIKEKCGFSVNSVDIRILSNAIQTGMQRIGIQDSDHFFDVLVNDATELIKVVNSLTVNETYFFREPQHFTILCKHLVPNILRENKPHPIKFISLGCSTGEEAYTIAIALVEEFGLEILKAIEIHAADIDSAVIKKAQTGIYGKHSFRAMDPEIKKKYFEPLSGQNYSLIDSIKGKVSFYHQNLLSETYPMFFQQSDVIFYRNVSIYFHNDSQRVVLRKVAQQLNLGGYLFLSSTETYGHDLGILSLTEIEGVFLFRKIKKKKTTSKPPSPSKVKSASMYSPARGPSSQGVQARIKHKGIFPNTQDCTRKKIPSTMRKHDCYREALAQANQKKYDLALRQLEKHLEKDPSSLKAQLLKASILLNLRRTGEAHDLCEQIIKKNELNYECILLLGIIAKERGLNGESTKRMKAAIFIQSSAWFPHYYLAQLYYAEEDYKLANREYSITINLLQKYGIDTPENLLLSLSFTKEELIYSCEYHRKLIREKLQVFKGKRYS